MSAIHKFTIRVYGILLNDKDEVLLVHEKMPHLHFTKFPGGGLEFEEGTIDCLIREFKEETGIDIGVAEHVYTTDFFQPSAFNKGDQLLAIYYRVFQLDPTQRISLEEQEITAGGKIETLRFFWKPIQTLDPNIDLTFPVDRIVARKFLSKKLDK